jgi:hypothetical protein
VKKVIKAMKQRIIFSAMLTGGLLTAALPGQFIIAQENQTGQGTEQGQTAQSQTEVEQAQNGSGDKSSGNGQRESDDAASAPQDKSGGFIPSEEISEDLSVSFPVDI